MHSRKPLLARKGTMQAEKGELYIGICETLRDMCPLCSRFLRPWGQVIGDRRAFRRYDIEDSRSNRRQKIGHSRAVVYLRYSSILAIH